MESQPVNMQNQSVTRRNQSVNLQKESMKYAKPISDHCEHVAAQRLAAAMPEMCMQDLRNLHRNLQVEIKETFAEFLASVSRDSAKNTGNLPLWWITDAASCRHYAA